MNPHKRGNCSYRTQSALTQQAVHLPIDIGSLDPRSLVTMRTEQQIFFELSTLCRSPGYVHAIATICFRDNFLTFNEKLRPEDMDHLFLQSRLIRTEIMTLIGLTIRGKIDFSLPLPAKLSTFVIQTDALLDELHRTIIESGKIAIIDHKREDEDLDPHMIAEVFREPIFYGGESAYSFQYRDFSVPKYSADADWLLQRKNVDLKVAHDLCRIVTRFIDDKLTKYSDHLKSNPELPSTILPGFTFSCADLAPYTNHPVESIKAVIEAFCMPESERNVTFSSVHSFNIAYAYPFFRYNSNNYLLLHHYGILEAIYDTPFYWMLSDKTYAQTALQHRGNFTETFAAERLKHVFGSDAVFRNVKLSKSKSHTLAEIDVLVVFGDRAIVLQAKSKKLTQEARKGNRLVLESDFKAAVQDSVDQSYTCARLIGEPSVSLQDGNGTTIVLKTRPRTIFPISVISDHYPALLLQVRQFLTAFSDDQIVSPLVIDIFALDTITEMLNSPLRLLSYLKMRALFGSNLMANHERVLLACHLRYNTWFKDNVDLTILNDDFSSHLDIAMAVRRDGVPGERVPEGILTCFNGTPLERVLSELENNPEENAVELGLFLLQLHESAVQRINDCLTQVITMTRADDELHDITLREVGDSTGLTLHCSNLSFDEAHTWLMWHCEKRKHQHSMTRWFGLSLRPTGSIHIVVALL